MDFRPEKLHRAEGAGVAGAPAVVMFAYPSFNISGTAGIESTVGAFNDIDKPALFTGHLN